MTILLYSLLAVMALFSGFSALSSDNKNTENTNTDRNGKTLVEVLSIVNKKDERAMVYSRIFALIVYFISVASMVTIYLIKV